MADIPFDENKMEKALQLLSRESEKIKEDDPRQAADLMRKLTDMTGLELGANMEEALSRMEQGEDPESVEADMGDLLNDEESFLLSGESEKRAKSKRASPQRDETLYDL